MPSRTGQPVDAPGQDSFLDIVANLVGILIILITVIGARATDAMVQAAPASGSDQPESALDIDGAKAEAEAVEADVYRMDAKIQRQQLEIDYRRTERDKFLQLVQSVEQLVDQKRSELDERHRQEFDANRALVAAREELEDLKATRHAMQNAVPPKNVIQHLPTPMAKTVFGREVHFRLENGRVAYVPWDELVQKLKAEAPQKVWKLKDVPKITEVLGPVRGFRLQYTLRHARRTTPIGGGAVAVSRRIELDHFVLVPMRDDLGEPLEDALRPGSAFRSILDGYDPDRTTVTVWVYPDSFGRFRMLKEALYQLGFLTAGRPMPEGQPIGGSPDGSRSAAQ